MKTLAYYLLTLVLSASLIRSGYLFATEHDLANAWRSNCGLLYKQDSNYYFFFRHADSVRFAIAGAMMGSPLLLLLPYFELVLSIIICCTTRLLIMNLEGTPDNIITMAGELAGLSLLLVLSIISGKQVKQGQQVYQKPAREASERSQGSISNKRR